MSEISKNITIPISQVPTYARTQTVTAPNGEVRSWSDVLESNPNYEIWVDSETLEPIHPSNTGTSSLDVLENQTSNYLLNSHKKGFDIYNGANPRTLWMRRALDDPDNPGNQLADITREVFELPFTISGAGAFTNFVLKPLVKGGIKYAIKSVPKITRHSKDLFTGKITKEAFKRGIQKAGARALETGVREVPRIAGSYLTATAGDKVSELATGNSIAENIAGYLNYRYGNRLGFEVSPQVAEFINPLWFGGYNLTNNLIPKFNTAKDFLWLAKTYNKVGTGLMNPYVFKKFKDLAKNPSLSRNFIQTYTRKANEANLNLNQIKEAIPQLLLILKEFNFVPKHDYNSWDNLDDQIKNVRNMLQKGKETADTYINSMDFLKNENKILYDIARESPLYLKLIVSDFRNGNITNLEQYVENLIRLSNTFLRRVNLKPGQNAEEVFTTIRGKSFGHRDPSMDVGDPGVVFNPIWARGYGDYAAVYTPKDFYLRGPIETWWSQRIPKFKDTSIYVNSKGMHTLLRFSGSNLYNDYLDAHNIPDAYDRVSSHMIFLSPNKGASIADKFNITLLEPGIIPDIRYTLGYKDGGIIFKKPLLKYGRT